MKRNSILNIFLNLFLINFVNCDIAKSCAQSFPINCICSTYEIKCIRVNLNQIPSVNSSLKSLIVFDLRYNYIQKIQANSFKYLSQLKAL